MMNELNPEDYYLNFRLRWGLENYLFDLRFNLQVFGYTKHTLLKNDKELPPPKALYKYYRANNNNLESIKDKYLYFPHPNTFNDPYDCLSHKDYVSLNEKDRVHRENLGVCCFSIVRDDVKMWGLYTDSYKGFCLKFSNNSEFLPYQEHLNIKSHVLYLRKYIEEHPNLLESLKIINDKVTHIHEFKDWITDFVTYYYQYCWKTTKWAYEKEYRMISLSSNDCNRKLNFTSNSLEEVYIGFNMEESYFNSLKNILNVDYPNAKIFRVKPNLNKVKLEFIKC